MSAQLRAHSHTDCHQEGDIRVGNYYLTLESRVSSGQLPASSVDTGQCSDRQRPAGYQSHHTHQSHIITFLVTQLQGLRKNKLRGYSFFKSLELIDF